MIEADEAEELQDNDDLMDLQLPGQKYAAPPDGDGTRIFYETLYTQVPTNKMAQKWLLEHGLLPVNEISKILKSFNR